jgi:hypothetical protein
MTPDIRPHSRGAIRSSSPRNGFMTFFVLPPVIGFFVTVVSRKLARDLNVKDIDYRARQGDFIFLLRSTEADGTAVVDDLIPAASFYVLRSTAKGHFKRVAKVR